MNPIIYKIRLDAGRAGSQASIYVKQGDVKSRQLSMFLHNNSVPYEIAPGVTAVLRAVKPDGTLVYDDCEISGNVIKHLMTSQMLKVAGTVSCELTIYGTNNEVLFSPEFDVYVTDPLFADDDIISASEFSALTTAMTRANEFADKWSNPSATALPGDTANVEAVFDENGIEFAFTLPIGPQGDKGDRGEIGDTERIIYAQNTCLKYGERLFC